MAMALSAVRIRSPSCHGVSLRSKHVAELPMLSSTTSCRWTLPLTVAGREDHDATLAVAQSSASVAHCRHCVWQREWRRISQAYHRPDRRLMSNFAIRSSSSSSSSSLSSSSSFGSSKEPSPPSSRKYCSRPWMVMKGVGAGTGAVKANGVLRESWSASLDQKKLIVKGDGNMDLEEDMAQYDGEEEEEEGEEKVELWEGDLPPMSEAEAAELLAEAEREINYLERESREGNRGGFMVEGGLGMANFDEDDEDEEANEKDEEGVESKQKQVEEEEADRQIRLLEQRKAEMLAELEGQIQNLKMRKGGAISTVETGTDGSQTLDGKAGWTELDDADDRNDGSAQGGFVEEREAVGSKVAKQVDEVLTKNKKVGEHEYVRKSTRRRRIGGPEAYEMDEEWEGQESKKTKERGMPAVMRCFDTAKIQVRSGDGGNGVVAFRREKYVPHGGPAGGNGGRGGHVFVEVDRSLNSLHPFRKQVHFRGGRGSHGQGKRMEGAAGSDVVVFVPPGTIIREAEEGKEGEGKILAELVRHKQKELLVAGGRGGRGNAAFKTGKNNAPQMAEKGEMGTEKWIELELKLVADVGIVGIPNAGKSTLLSVISAAKPKIAAYPFTTLVPNLGVVEIDFESLVFADIPGLLEGAHTGIGLGQEFLRHIERCRTLVHIVDGTSPDPIGDYHAICSELQLFNSMLAEKPQVVVFNKIDVPEALEKWPAFLEAITAAGVPDAKCMSAVTGEGTTEIVRAARNILLTVPNPYDPADDLEDDRKVERDRKIAFEKRIYQEKQKAIEEFSIEEDSHSRTWHVNGDGLERFTQMTNWEYYEAVKRFVHVLEAIGVDAELRKRGVREGDSIMIGGFEFDWKDSGNFSEASGWKRGFRGSKVWPH